MGSCGKTTVPSGTAWMEQREPEVPQVVEKGGLEGAEPGEILQVLVGEAQTLHQVEELFQAGEDGEAVVRRQFAEGVVEAGVQVFATGLPVAGHHGELVVVGQQRQVLALGPALRDVGSISRGAAISHSLTGLPCSS